MLSSGIGSSMRILALIALVACCVYAKTDADAQAVACASFVSSPESSCQDEAWQGSYKDEFSPDDICPVSRRFIRLGYPHHPDGKLHVSANGTDAHCTSSWGKLFSTSVVDPIVIPMSKHACEATVSFRSKIPVEAPVQPFVQEGALDFLLTLGSIGGDKAIRFSGMYMGKGGTWLAPSGSAVHLPANSCDNIWLAPQADELFIRVANTQDEHHRNLSTALFVAIGMGALLVGVYTLVAQYRRKQIEDSVELDQLKPYEEVASYKSVVHRLGA